MNMLTSASRSENMLGIKMLCAVILLILRMDTLKDKLMILCKSSIKKIYPVDALALLNDS